MRFRSSILLLFAALLIPACKGGSGSGGSQGASFALHIETAAGVTDLLGARIAGVVFETAGGALSANLLSAPVDVVLADPSGESRGLALSGSPPAGSLAVHLVVQGGAFALRANGTSVPVALPSADLRIPIEGTWTAGSTAALSIAHASAPVLTSTANGLAWTPALVARVASQLAILSSNAVVASANAAAGTLVVMLPGYQDLSFDVLVPSTSRLVGSDGGGRSRDDFFRECGAGSTVSFEGLRHSSRGVESNSMHHRGRSRGELHLLGRIASLDAPTSSFVLDVQGMRSSTGWGQAPFTAVTVDAATAVIYTSHRSVRTSATFGDLLVGMLVKVEGGQPQSGRMIAREVEIEDDHGQHRPGELEGQVASVDIGARTIAVVQRGDDPLLVGGVRVTSATIEVTPSTLLERKTNSGTETTTLSAITNADRIWVRGEVTGTNSVRAQWVRVEAR